jgi:glutamyl-tRNA reductase
MSLLVIGVSHRSADLALLERVALDSAAAVRLGGQARTGEHVGEALILATCNRVEMYADVATFHGGLSDLGSALASFTGVPLDELTEHLYVHYEDRAVAHLFTVVCGLDSMAIGEGQILGQVRQALRAVQASGDAGRVLDELFQQALRVGKRAHTETGIDGAGRSIVEAGIDRATAVLAERPASGDAALSLAGRTALVVGAGSMSSLVAATLIRRGVTRLIIANRTPERAVRLAHELGATAIGLDGLDDALGEADIVVSCTGSVGHVIAAAAVDRAQTRRAGRPQAFVDLALPRDIDPEISGRPNLSLADLESIGQDIDGRPGQDSSGLPSALPSAVQAVRDLVAEEVAEYLVRRRAEAVAPTVVALRARAAEVVAAELARLEQRRPDLDPEVREELRRTVNRVVDKLLHAPTVRVKELAGVAEPADYAAALRDLFDLDPHDIAAVSTARLDEVVDIGGPR